MDILVKTHLILHIIAGLSTLVAGPIAIFYNFKQVKKHRIAGQVFFYAMLYVCASAVVGYFRHSDKVFYQFLLGIAILVAAGIFRGVRAIQRMKKDRVRPVDYIHPVGLVLFGGWMLWRSFASVQAGGEVIWTVLFGVFGVGATADAVGDLRRLFGQLVPQPTDWYLLHVRSMLGAFTASTTAFLVNVGSEALPWPLVWFGPTLALLPLRFYFVRKIKQT
jgi:hypothetical protein